MVYEKYLTLKNLGWLLTVIVTFMLGMGGLSKIMGSDTMTANFTAMNMLPYMEVIGVVALCIPRTSIYGAVLLSSVMSGAIAVHIAMFGGAGLFMPMFLGAAAWGGHCLRTYYK